LEKLECFIREFLVPIAADGQINQGIEETPLIAAYHAYGVGEQLRRDFASVDARLQQAVQAALSGKGPPPSANWLSQAWERINQFASWLSEGEYSEMREWCLVEAKRHGLAIDFLEPPNRPEFRQQPLDRDCIPLFYKYFQEAQRAVSPLETPIAVPPEVTVYHADVAEATIERVASGSLRARLRQRSDRIVQEMEDRLSAGRRPKMDFEGEHGNQAVIVPSLHEDANLWFVGDIHGDLLGLECVLDYIDAFPRDAPPRIVFLGDLFDDGPLGYEVVLRVFRLLLKRPGRVCVLAGNHDEALARDGAVFRSSAWPSDFTDWLNEQSDNPLAARLGGLIIEFFRGAPRALFLPDGLLVAHGGVVHVDLLEGISSCEDLNQPLPLQDFVWTRLHPRAPRRIPNRTTRGCEVGREDFERFCERMTEVLGQPVKRMVRGHDHVEGKERYGAFDRYVKNPVLTINTMCFRLPREVLGPQERSPCLGRWRPGQLPEVHCLHVPERVIHQLYPMVERDQADATVDP